MKIVRYMVLLVLAGFAGACVMAWNMPVEWRYEKPPAPFDGQVRIVWPLRIVVRIDPTRRDDVGLHAHEQVHVTQIQRFRPFQFVHIWRRRVSSSYRENSELEARKMQAHCLIDVSCYCSTLRETPVKIPQYEGVSLATRSGALWARPGVCE